MTVLHVHCATEPEPYSLNWSEKSRQASCHWGAWVPAVGMTVDRGLVRLTTASKSQYQLCVLQSLPCLVHLTTTSKSSFDPYRTGSGEADCRASRALLTPALQLGCNV
jgi:hypothetical protein